MPGVDDAESVAEQSRPCCQFSMDDKKKNKPEGRKRTNLQKPAIRVNWKSPFLWGQIEMAATLSGKPWRPHDIVLQAKRMDPVAFCHLTEQVVGRWIDREARDNGVYKWKDSVLYWRGFRKGMHLVVSQHKLEF